MTRYRHKTDGNQIQIRRELRALFFRVDTVSKIRKLGYDLVVTGKDGNGIPRTVRVELKTDGGKLTADELDYHNSEPYPETLIIATSTEDVLKWFAGEV
jgi:hypothetical protein